MGGGVGWMWVQGGRGWVIEPLHLRDHFEVNRFYELYFCWQKFIQWKENFHLDLKKKKKKRKEKKKEKKNEGKKEKLKFEKKKKKKKKWAKVTMEEIKEMWRKSKKSWNRFAFKG